MDQDLDDWIFGGQSSAPRTLSYAGARGVGVRSARGVFRAAGRAPAGRQCPADTGRWHGRTVEIRRFY